MTASDWIKLRLDAGTTFTKNGVTLTVDQAVASALADYIGKPDGAQRRYALADLLEIELSDAPAEGERQGDYSAGKTASVLRDRITRLRAEAAAIEHGGTALSEGGITFVDADLTPLCMDENARCP